MMGIDLVLPDISALVGRTDAFRGLVLTHGHEDHIGAVPSCSTSSAPAGLRHPVTSGLLRNKLAEHDSGQQTRLEEVRPREPFALGVFEVECHSRAAHSIVDAVGLAIRTPAGPLVHTGDFKLDQTPVDGEPTDLARLAAYGDEGVLLLLPTRPTSRTKGTRSRSSGGRRAFDRILRAAAAGCWFSTFSSNVHRIQQVVELAPSPAAQDRGTAAAWSTTWGSPPSSGYLQVPRRCSPTSAPGPAQAEQGAAAHDRQPGRTPSALSRIAMDDHRQIKIEPGTPSSSPPASSPATRRRSAI